MKHFWKRLGTLALMLCLLLMLMPVRAEAAAGNFQRIGGENRFETAFQIADEMKAELGVDKFQTIIIASGTNFADALSGSYLANVKSAPILLSYNDTYNNKAKEYIKNNLVSGGTVYILGGTAAVPESMESGLSGFQVRRLAGDNRFETNLLILKEAGVSAGEKVLVCTGTNFADSLSASATGLPILLVYNESGELMDSQKEYLATLDSEYYVIGGTGAVSNETARHLFNYGLVYRVGGDNRFETSVKVAKIFMGYPSEAVLAYAWNYPDGLCGGPLAYVKGCPLILTMTGYEQEADAYTQSWYIMGGTVLGSTKLISDQSARMIFTCAKPGNEYRQWYDLGSAKQLTGSPYVLAFFVDDDESSWDSESVSYVWNNKIQPALSYLEERAGQWGVGLDFQTGSYYTGMNEGVSVRYDGTIFDNLDHSSGASYSFDVLDQISASLGFESKEAMDQYIRNYSGATDVVYLVVVNKDGRCYAVPDSYHNASDTLEYALVYSYGGDYEYEVLTASIAHEILHTFGAEDYYYEGQNNAHRSELASQLYPKDIMLTVEWEVSNNTLGDYTAYCVGWTDQMPSVCYDLNWYR